MYTEVENAKVFIGDQEIGISNDIDFNMQPKEEFKMPIFEPLEISIELKCDNPEQVYKIFDGYFKYTRVGPLPRKTRKAFYKAIMMKRLTIKEHKRINNLMAYWNKRNYNG